VLFMWGPGRKRIQWTKRGRFIHFLPKSNVLVRFFDLFVAFTEILKGCEWKFYMVASKCGELSLVVPQKNNVVESKLCFNMAYSCVKIIWEFSAYAPGDLAIA
jgi:hypothetical protein